MPGRQSRRSVSVRGATYAALRLLAARLGTSGSSLVERALADLFAEVDLPVRTPHAPPEPTATRRPRPPSAEERTPRPGPGNVRSF